MTTTPDAKIPDSINFPEEEEKILKFWEENECFKNCLKQSKNRPRYTFYDGPPFATGLPHYGHILAGTIKDIVTRYAHQQGYHVERRFGWDCHGLPIEFEIDKLFNIKTPEEIYTKMGGIENYNNECRKIVMRYAGEWKQIIGRMGRWIDFENDYKTMYPSFMESVWWVFKQLFVKGLVYRGVKVMPYSTACTTPLSNFESGQNYKEVVDPSVVVTFPLVEDKAVAFLAWTTTPWTLPSNLALCVNPELEYCEVKEKKTGKRFILMECRLEFAFGKDHAQTLEVLKKFKGSTLVGKKYVPLFEYFTSNKEAFRVLSDGYVSNENGTGIVHQAPFFGEDDYRVCLKSGVIGKEDNYCPIDECGRFVDPVVEFKGIYVKDADKQIIKLLKEKDRLISAGQIKHSYPFCWRSDTPLIYKAVPSWFVRVEQFQQKLVNCSSQTYWVPEFVKDKRFGNWLKEARDWAISRNRYWGTPIPIWASDDFQEIIAIGSVKELSELSGVPNIPDLHRENIDKITIPSRRPGHAPLKRIPEVFDCWFESGSMPFAQQHYPFENAQEFESMFPADFIAEGIDQTRGWFYTLIVVSTLLFNKPPFKNLIANGLVLASDGQKMSKRKQNYPDPMIVVKSYGADALRLYLINSPVVRAENLKFKEEGVRDVVKDVFLPWFNAFRFFYQNVDRLFEVEKVVFTVDPNFVPSNVMDQWIVSFKESLLEFVGQEMKAYRLYTVVPRLTKFIDQLTNWYVRLNRRRIKGEFGTKDCLDSLNTMFDILMSMSKMMAPFTPYLTEYMFQRLVKFERATADKPSVHYEMMPKVVPSRINKEIEDRVSLMQRIIELGRILRDRKTIPIKYPLSEIIVLLTTHDEKAIRGQLEEYEVFIKSELNVRKIVYTNDKSKFGVRIVCEPDHKVLGVKHKANYKKLVEQVKSFTEEQVDNLQRTGELNVKVSDKESVRIGTEEVKFLIRVEKRGEEDLVGESDHELLVLLNCKQDESLLEEGMAREVINRVQKLKKKLNLVSTDLVYVCYEMLEGSDAVLKKFKAFIETAVKSELNAEKEFAKSHPKLGSAAEEEVQLQGMKFKLSIYKEMVKCHGGFVNVLLLHPRGNQVATVLLNPTVTLTRLTEEVKNVFRFGAMKHLHFMDKQRKEVTEASWKKQSPFVFAYLEEHEKFVNEDPKLWNTVKAEVVGVKDDQPACRFANFTAGGAAKSMLVENPRGVQLFGGQGDLEVALKEVFGKKIEALQFS